MTVRQYRMLERFTRQNFTIEQALTLDQRTFGSLCRQRWVDFFYGGTPSFRITPNGQAWVEHHRDWTMMRNDPTRPFSLFVSSGAKNYAKRKQLVRHA